MNVENLCEGLIIKNYKELCVLLEIKVTGGDSKKSQLKDLERYCKYHKEGNKFIIDEIYSEVKMKVDMRNTVKDDDKRHEGNSSVYGDDIKRLLLYLMASSNEDDEIILPISILLNKLSMTNINYSLGRRNQEKLSEILKIDEIYINEFYDTTHQNLRRTLESNLNQLDRKSILRWQTVRMICKRVAEVKYNELDEIIIDMDTNTINYDIREEYSVATKEQDLIILEAENEVLKELDLSDINEVFKYGKADIFYNKVYSIIKKKANIKYYFNGYKLIFNKDIVIGELEKYGEDVDCVRKELNKKVREKLFDNAMKRQEKVEKEFKDIIGELPLSIKEVKKLRLKDDYLKQIQIIIDNVINITANDIRYKLKQKVDYK